MNNREQQLLQMGFKYNPHQLQYELSKYEVLYRVEIWKLTDYTDRKWNILIEDIKYDLQEVKKRYYEDLRMSYGYNLAEKEIKKKLKDEYNKYNSWLQQETQFKIGRGNPNLIRETELRAKVELLKELINKL